MSSARRRGVAAREPARPFKPSSPYRGTFQPPYNAADRLAIPTPVAGTNAMHPDVIDFGASGWHGYRYWMAFTPYNGDGNTEVPCIVATNDITNGGTWVVPTGYTNPITPDPAGVEAHMADTDLVYDASSDRLYVFYISEDIERTTAEGAPIPSFQSIRSKWTSGDGVWSTEVDVVVGPDGSHANPSVIKTATGWRIYFQRGFVPIDGLYYRDTTTTPDAGYGAEQTASCPLNYGGVTRQFQNLNVVRDTDGTIVAVISDSDTATINGTLYFARSTDGGQTFKITGPPVLEKGHGNPGIPADKTGWDGGGIYRASLLVDTTGTVVPAGTDLHLWYSAFQASSTTVWGTGYTKIPAACLRL